MHDRFLYSKLLEKDHNVADSGDSFPSAVDDPRTSTIVAFAAVVDPCLQSNHRYESVNITGIGRIFELDNDNDDDAVIFFVSSSLFLSG